MHVTRDLRDGKHCDVTSKICEWENASTRIPPNFVTVIPLNTCTEVMRVRIRINP